MADKLRLTILSFSCCNPRLASYDQQYAERLKEALKAADIEADIDLVHATEAQMSTRYAFMAEIMPLIQKYGTAVTPALFINGKLYLYGGVPTLDKLVEVLKKAKLASDQGRI
ncbi:MAG: thioredoxin family protein [Methanomassiliicoccales archaeon]|jgi:protein-disulfide isomerase